MALTKLGHSNKVKNGIRFKVAMFLSTILFGVIFFSLVLHYSHTAENEDSIAVIWPDNNISLTGGHVFAAHIPYKPLSSYKLFLEIPNLEPLEMNDSFEEIPHKEIFIDVSQIKELLTVDKIDAAFVAYDDSGKILSKKTVTVQADSSERDMTINALNNQVATVEATSPLKSENFMVVWATKDKSATLNHTFSGSINGVPESNYYMFWQVGNGKYTRMLPLNKGDTTVYANINFSSWTWNGDGPYELKFIVQNRNGKELFKKSLALTRTKSNNRSIMTLASATPPTTNVIPPALNFATTTPTLAVNDTPKLMLPVEKKLYKYHNQASKQKLEFIEKKDFENSEKISTITNHPQAIWLNRGDERDVNTIKDVIVDAKKQGTIPVFVLYTIPNRDCNSYSSGGVENDTQYLEWVKTFASLISDHTTIVIVEPDAIAQSSCLSTVNQDNRLAVIQSAVKTLSVNKKTSIYIDIGHPYWLTVSKAVEMLKLAGIAYARGFSLNVSNYILTSENILYGKEISSRLDGAHFVIDTSRNGNGPTSKNEWCNPSGRALGAVPTLSTGETLVDAFLWIKNPGESDGTCNGGPSAGSWWLEQALGYINATVK